MRTKRQHLWKSNPRCFSDTSFRLSYRASSDEKFAVSFLNAALLCPLSTAPDLGAGAVSQLGRGDSGSVGRRKSALDITAQHTDTWCTLGTFAWSRICFYVVWRVSRENCSCTQPPPSSHPPPPNKINPSHVAKRVQMFFWTRGSVWEPHRRAHAHLLWRLQTQPACCIN